MKSNDKGFCVRPLNKTFVKIFGTVGGILPDYNFTIR